MMSLDVLQNMGLFVELLLARSEIELSLQGSIKLPLGSRLSNNKI